MRKICVFLLAVLLIITMAGCKKTVTLHCDGENCDNAVEFKVPKDTVVDESWVVFCETCAEQKLNK